MTYTPRTNCPTPRKASWTDEATARKALKDIKRSGHTEKRPNAVYLCECGRWHLTSKGKR